MKLKSQRIVTICMGCKRIRRSLKGKWLREHTNYKKGALLSHGWCPRCFEIESKRVDEELANLRF
ncbi:MAG: hypothetical protein KBB55_02315 [Candidatus Buchananbacteria bacterium]|nr:hypothetical protein [Candidatus Buchananbacteria bacterium]